MSEEEAENWRKTNPATAIEKVPGSEEVRYPGSGQSMPPS
jgi:hypothetical protein